MNVGIKSCIPVVFPRTLAVREIIIIIEGELQNKFCMLPAFTNTFIGEEPTWQTFLALLVMTLSLGQKILTRSILLKVMIISKAAEVMITSIAALAMILSNQAKIMI